MDNLEPARETGSQREPMGKELGRELWKVQLAQAVSLLADVSVMWIILWWLFVHRKSQYTVADALLATWPIGAGWLVYVVALPFCGLLADRFSRRHLAAVGCAARSVVHVILWVCLARGRFDTAWAPALHAVAMLGGALFDAASLSMVPSIVPPTRRERGMSYALVLPRAGTFLSGMICLLLVAILGVANMSLCGALFCAIAAILCASITFTTRPEPAAEKSLLRDFSDGPAMLVRTPRLALLAFLTGLVNFLLYPLYQVVPALGKQALSARNDLPTNIELCLVGGVLVGLWATPKLCTPSRMSAEQVVMLSLFLLGAGLAALGYSQLDLQAYVASAVIGFAMMQLMGLTGTAAILNTPDSHRGRVVALFAALFELGGWAGSALLSPQIHAHGAGITLTIAALPLCLFGLYGLLSRRAPRILVA